MFERLRRDLARHFALDSRDGSPGVIEKLRILWDAPQLSAVAAYRYGRWVNENVPTRALRLPLKAVYHVWDKTTHAAWGVHIDERADIGAGLYIGHPGSVLIGPAKIGADCNIGHQVTIGRRTDQKGGGTPNLGDRVWVGTGSVIFGSVTIGAGASVGPLTAVGRNVPPRALVTGNPMQVLRKEHDNTAQIYGTHPLSGGT